MKKIDQLFNPDYIVALFKRRILPLYPDFRTVLRTEVIPHKNNVWENSYHVVLEFKTYFSDHEGKIRRLSIFCSAHDHEPRQNPYYALKYLWQNGFQEKSLSIPRPLFYSEYFNGFFYRGVEGPHLLSLIEANDRPEIESVVKSAAAWLVKLHHLPLTGMEAFNTSNSRIRTVIPGSGHILSELKLRYDGYYYEPVKKIYDYLIAAEEKFLDSNSERWLVHGDAHPENIIKTGTGRIAFIDFADLCIADFARDLGSFLQQLDYKITSRLKDLDYSKKLRKLFLDEYFSLSELELSPELQDRIKVYYNFTAIRTATFWLLKHAPKPYRAEPILAEIKRDLAL